jgi:two-component system, OmpR family, copper resistance phosphate regulon response regulator CusR
VCSRCRNPGIDQIHSAVLLAVTLFPKQQTPSSSWVAGRYVYSTLTTRLSVLRFGFKASGPCRFRDENANRRVLVVEDEHRVATYVSRALIEETWAVDVAHDGLKGWDLARTHDYDAIVLDLMLPHLDGITLCQRLRRAGRKTPVLMLSARDMVEDRVRGLDAGADDYLVKPFAIEELIARLRSLHRRRDASPVLAVGSLTLDPATRTVRRACRTIALSAKEYALLEYFMRHADVVLTRTMIAEHVWDFTFEQASNVVDVCVKRLREKIDGDGEPSVITRSAEWAMFSAIRARLTLRARSE